MFVWECSVFRGVSPSWELAWGRSSLQRKFGVFSHPKNKISSNFPGTGSQARLPGTIPKPGSQEQVPRQGSQARVPETVAKQGSQEQVPKQGSQEQVSKKRLQKRFPRIGSQARVSRQGSWEPVSKQGSQDQVPKQGSQEQVHKQGFQEQCLKFPSKGSKNRFPCRVARLPTSAVRSWLLRGILLEKETLPRNPVPNLAPCGFGCSDLLRNLYYG